MKTYNKIFSTGKTWILIGLLLVVGSAYASNEKDVFNIFISFIKDLGFALISLGIVAVIINFNDWTKYFQERLKETVIERSYLKTLSDKELNDLQVQTLRAKYKNTDIDSDGSFLHYFQKKIQDYINFPYRDHVTCSLNIEEDEEDNECFFVNDTISYVCREIGGKIQEDVKWAFEPNEFKKIYNLKIKIKCSSEKDRNCKNDCKSNDNCENGVIKLSKEALDRDYFSEDNHTKSYNVDLKNLLKTSDKLQIELNAKYSISKYKMFTWAMTHPSKNLSFTIIFPRNYHLNTFVGGIEPFEYTNNYNGNMYTFNHEGWFLPRTGLSWNLVKKV